MQTKEQTDLAGPLAEALMEVAAFRQSTVKMWRWIAFGMLFTGIGVAWSIGVALGAVSEPFPGFIVPVGVVAGAQLAFTWVQISRHFGVFGEFPRVHEPLRPEQLAEWSNHLRALPLSDSARDVVEEFLLCAPTRPSAAQVVSMIRDAEKELAGVAP